MWHSYIFRKGCKFLHGKPISCQKRCSKIQNIWHQIQALNALKKFTHINHHQCLNKCIFRLTPLFGRLLLMIIPRHIIIIIIFTLLHYIIAFSDWPRCSWWWSFLDILWAGLQWCLHSDWGKDEEKLQSDVKWKIVWPSFVKSYSQEVFFRLEMCKMFVGVTIKRVYIE